MKRSWPDAISLSQNPKDISYVFSGYAPLSVRLVELLEKPNGWAAFEEVSEFLMIKKDKRGTSLLRILNVRSCQFSDSTFFIRSLIAVLAINLAGSSRLIVCKIVLLDAIISIIIFAVFCVIRTSSSSKLELSADNSSGGISVS